MYVCIQFDQDENINILQIRWNTFCSCIMKKLSQHGTTWNSQVMMLSVMVRTFVTLCRDKCVWSYVTLWNSAQGIWNIKDKEEVYISTFCGYIGKNLHTIIFSSFYESFKHSKIIHCCFFRKCEMAPLHSQSMLSELLCIISPWQFLCAVELEILHNNYLI